MFFPCSAKRRASDKDLPVLIHSTAYLSNVHMVWQPLQIKFSFRDGYIGRGQPNITFTTVNVQTNVICEISALISMTQLLSHTIAHFTGPSFML